MAATGLVAMTMALSSYIVVAKSNYESRTELQSREKLARLWDDVESRALQVQRPGSRRLQDPDDPDVLAVALHALKEYDVLGDPGWRLREDIRSLPADDRVDLEFWLMEQAYRYCRALESRPGSPGDWLRAMATLDRVNTSPPLGALEDLRDRLRARLEGNGAFDSLARGPWLTRPVAAGRPIRTGSQGSRDSAVDLYLQGLASEFEDGPDQSTDRKARDPRHRTRSVRPPGPREAGGAALPGSSIRAHEKPSRTMNTCSHTSRVVLGALPDRGRLLPARALAGSASIHLDCSANVGPRTPCSTPSSRPASGS